MSREPNETDADEYNDRLFADHAPEIDCMDAYKNLLEAEDVERARNELLDTGKFGSVQHGTPDYFSIVKRAALQAHSDFCVTHSIPQPFKPKD